VCLEPYKLTEMRRCDNNKSIDSLPILDSKLWEVLCSEKCHNWRINAVPKQPSKFRSTYRPKDEESY